MTWRGALCRNNGTIYQYAGIHIPAPFLYNFVEGGAEHMGMQENMADILRAKRKLSGQSIDDWSKKLEIAPSTLQDYLKGSSNPTVKMVEHLARKLDVDPIALVAGKMDADQYEVVLLMLDTIQAVSSLPQDKRLRFAELFLESVRLWEE